MPHGTRGRRRIQGVMAWMEPIYLWPGLLCWPQGDPPLGSIGSPSPSGSLRVGPSLMVTHQYPLLPGHSPQIPSQHHHMGRHRTHPGCKTQVWPRQKKEPTLNSRLASRPPTLAFWMSCKADLRPEEKEVGWVGKGDPNQGS